MHRASMGAPDGQQSNWPEMRKTLGNLWFRSTGFQKLAKRTGIELFDVFVFPMILMSSKAVIDYAKHRQFVHWEHSRILRGGRKGGDQGGTVRNRN